MYTVSGIAVFFILLMGIFIAWQFKMLKKYALSYDKFKIHPTEGYISQWPENILQQGTGPAVLHIQFKRNPIQCAKTASALCTHRRKY